MRNHILTAVTVSVCFLFGLAAMGYAGEKPATDGDKVEKHSEVAPSVVTLRDSLRKQYGQIENTERNLEAGGLIQVGERLTYSVKWKGVPVGKLTLRVKRKYRMRGDREAFQFEMRTESNRMLDVIYPVDTVIKSYADVETGQSYMFRRKGREGRSRVLDDRLEFDYDHKDKQGRLAPVSRYSKVKNNKAKHNAPRPIPGPVVDALSIIYYMRHIPLSKEAKSEQVLIGSRKRVDVCTITVKDFEQRDIGKLGTYDSIVVVPTGDEDADNTNLVAAEGHATVWLEKNTRVPLLVSVDVPFGSVSATLIETENVGLRKFAVGEGTPDEDAAE